MRLGWSIQRSAVIIALTCVTAAPAIAEIPTEVQHCRAGLARASATLIKRRLKTIQNCNDRALQVPGACAPPAPAETLSTLDEALRAGVAKSCASLPDRLLGAGYLNYPGPCPDATLGDGFTLSDLQSCLIDNHDAIVDGLVAVEYNSTNVLDQSALGCQKAIATNAGKFTALRLKAIQKCRNSADQGKNDILPDTCATEDAATVGKITTAETNLRASIATRCTPSELQEIGICSNSACAAFCTTCDVSCVVECLLATHGDAVSSPDDFSSDFIDFEYPPPAPGPTCGDGSRNQLGEECDGSDDGACPGNCGALTSPFPCLCLDKRRERVIEHADTDLDTGWTGRSHDSALVEGGGYFLDLYDCDGPQGPDTLCTVGPSCSVAPHPACSKNADCVALGLGTCRKEVTATGPHCNFDVQTACLCDLNSTIAQPTCIDEAHCPGVGNYCIQQFHTPPLPLSAGGIPVCVVNVFTDDVVGTKDLSSGSSAVRLRQKSIVQLTGTTSQPCPVCGGFCKAGANDLAGRHNCTTNADCADTAAHTCVSDNICSFGPNQGQLCRPDPPYGGPTPLFGNPSIDCPPALTSPGKLDIVFDPQTTDTVTLQPNFQCDQPEFSGKTCIGGGSEGASCTGAADCAGGSCNDQCFCPVGGGVLEQPNACDPACVGGLLDGAPCSADTDCVGGFCHAGDCRPDPDAPAAQQPHEGGCTATLEGRCSYSRYQTCASDAQCAQASCPNCQPNETCDIFPKNCYINAGITRVGVASTTDPVLSAIFCIAQTGQASVDSTAGLPGPGAIRQTSTVIDTGF